MLEPQKTLALAELVARTAGELGIQTALIGASALAVHGYARGTNDIDLAVVVLEVQLRALSRKLELLGLQTELRVADDADDPLGGVLAIMIPDEQGDLVEVVEVVNFLNPFRAAPNPAVRAIAHATPLDGLALRCVALADLVALKLYAGALSDLADIVELLAANPEVELETLQSAAGPFDLSQSLVQLFARAHERRRT